MIRTGTGPAARAMMCVVLLLVTTTVVAPPVTAAPAATATPDEVDAGSYVTVAVNGFPPNEAVVIHWDWTPYANLDLDEDGAGSMQVRVPAGTPEGAHKVRVCRAMWDGACWSGSEGIEATAEVVVRPLPDDAPRGNVQVWALEVTQGVRGQVPTRDVPDGSPVLPADDWSHTAYRRTVVRAYPWISFDDHVGGFGRFAPPASAELHGWRDGKPLPGSPLTPINAGMPLPTSLFLQGLRASSGGGLNFVLPWTWTAPGHVDLEVRINPDGPFHVPECDGCDDDNTARLHNIEFEEVSNENARRHARFLCSDCPGAPSPIWRFEPVMVTLDRHWPTGRSLEWDTPSNVASMVQALQAIYPISDMNWILHPPQWDTYHGAVYCWGKDETPPVHEEDYNGCRAGSDREPFYQEMRSRYSIIKDTGTEGKASHRGWFMPFIWSDTNGCSKSWAYLNNPYSQTVECRIRPDSWTGMAYLEHELGHSSGLHHAGNSHDEKDGGGYDRDYPASLHGGMEPTAYGFHVYGMRGMSPFPEASRTGVGEHTHDYMSYGLPTTWTSIYTWNKMRRLMGGDDAADSGWTRAGGAVTADKAIVLTGAVHKGGSIELDPAWPTSSPVSPASSTGEGVQVTAMANDAEVGRWVAPTGTISNRADTRTLHFSAPIELPTEATELVLSHPWLTNVHVIELSGAAPEVRTSGLQPGDVMGASGQRLSWTVMDPDGDPTWVRVEASKDGHNWTTVVPGTQESSAALDPARVDGYGKGWTVRVLASDGVRVGEALVPDIEVPAKAPYPYLLEPSDGQIFGVDDTIILRGQGADWEDGVLPDVKWFIRSEPVGTGPEVRIKIGRGGEHPIRMVATNSAGLSATDSINVQVGIDADRDRLLDAWAAKMGLDPWNATDADGDGDGDGLRNWQEQTLGTHPANADTDGDGVPDGAEANLGGDPTDPSIRPPEAQPWHWVHDTPVDTADPGPQDGAGGTEQGNVSRKDTSTSGTTNDTRDDDPPEPQDPITVPGPTGGEANATQAADSGGSAAEPGHAPTGGPVDDGVETPGVSAGPLVTVLGVVAALVARRRR